MATILPDELRQIASVLNAIGTINTEEDAQVNVEITFTDVNGDFLARAGVEFGDHAATGWSLYTHKDEEEN